MFGIFGMVLTVAMVFGGYMLAGGKLGVITHALPFELMIILGAAVGSFLLSNQPAILKATPRALVRSFKGPSWTLADHQSVLCLMYRLLKLARDNPVQLEEHIDNPAGSDIFADYPRLLADHEAVALITDTMRSANLNYDDPHQVEETLTKRTTGLRDEQMHLPHALQTTADALPALGIVAAVLGVIKTMSAIDQPPEILGEMIGGALVGTFLGVFLAYGFVAPLANRLGSIIRQDLVFYDVIKSVLIAGLQQHPTGICVEVGRQTIPDHSRPSFEQLETALRDLKRAA
jgi:chemotaxis protein MotA